MRSLDPWQHLITVHDQGPFRNGADVRAALHVDFPTLQYDAGKVPEAVTAYQLVRQFSGDWPVLAHEVTWEGSTKLDADQVRRGAWGVALAGGIVNYAEMFEGPNQGQPANYGDGGAFGYLAILFEFIQSLNHGRLRPRPDLVDAEKLCLAAAGGPYICYAPAGGAIRVALPAAPGEHSVQWLNPRTGTRVAAGTIVGGRSITLDPPFSGDAVLILGK